LAIELHLVCFGLGVLIAVHTFAVIISLHTRKYNILLHLASKKLGFTLLLLNFIPTKVEQ